MNIITNVPSNPSCSICFKLNLVNNQTFKLCSGCKIVFYCSEKHQRQDWKDHKQFCKEIGNFNEKHGLTHCFQLFKHVPDSIDKIKRFMLIQKSLENYLQEKLERVLDDQEKNVIHRPCLCRICLNYNFKELTPCEVCNFVYYCSDAHKEQDKERHKKFCKLILLNKNYNECPDYRTSLDLEFPENVIFKKFPSDLLEFFYQITGEMCDEIPKSIKSYQLLNTVSNLTFITTILFVFYSIESYQNDSFDNFVIDVVGVEEEYIFSIDPNSISILKYFMENIKKLEINFIGPEIQNELPGFDKLENGFDYNLKNKIVKFNFFKKRYEELEFDVKNPPNLIISFNCGFHENYKLDNDPWMNGIMKFFQKNQSIPICFTSFTKTEAMADLCCVQEIYKKINEKNELKVIFDAMLNPFRDRRPVKNTEFMTDEVFFVNNYISLIIPEN